MVQSLGRYPVWYKQYRIPAQGLYISNISILANYFYHYVTGQDGPTTAYSMLLP